MDYATENISKAIITVLDSKSSGNKNIEVQYNPSSITFTTETRKVGLNSIHHQKSVNEVISQNTSPAITVMNLELIFDDYNNHSVREKINDFNKIILCSESRKITFSWSNLEFSGEINSVTSDLTMFNELGEPIRGKVRFSIQQKEDGSDKKQKERDDKIDNLFDTSDSIVDAQPLKNEMGNLLNLNIF